MGSSNTRGRGRIAIGRSRGTSGSVSTLRRNPRATSYRSGTRQWLDRTVPDKRAAVPARPGRVAKRRLLGWRQHCRLPQRHARDRRRRSPRCRSPRGPRHTHRLPQPGWKNLRTGSAPALCCPTTTGRPLLLRRLVLALGSSTWQMPIWATSLCRITATCWPSGVDSRPLDLSLIHI